MLKSFSSCSLDNLTFVNSWIDITVKPVYNNFCVQNRQVFGLYRLNGYRFSTLGNYLKFRFYRIPFYSGFSLDRLWQRPFSMSEHKLYVTFHIIVKIRPPIILRKIIYNSDGWNNLLKKYYLTYVYYTLQYWWVLLTFQNVKNRRMHSKDIDAPASC